jgi:hypothetical protein
MRHLEKLMYAFQLLISSKIGMIKGSCMLKYFRLGENSLQFYLVMFCSPCSTKIAKIGVYVTTYAMGLSLEDIAVTPGTVYLHQLPRGCRCFLTYCTHHLLSSRSCSESQWDGAWLTVNSDRNQEWDNPFRIKLVKSLFSYSRLHKLLHV